MTENTYAHLVSRSQCSKSSTLKRYPPTGPIMDTIYLSALPKEKKNIFMDRNWNLIDGFYL